MLALLPSAYVWVCHSGSVNSTLGIRRIDHSIIAELVKKTKGTVSIHTVGGTNRVCIDAISSASSPLRTVVQPVEQVSLLSGSGSKMLMSFMPKTEAAPFATKLAQASRRSQAELLAELAKIRIRGFAVSYGERLSGISAISAPVKNANDEVHYCLSLGGPTVRIHVNECVLIGLVVEPATTISRQFGGAGGNSRPRPKTEAPAAGQRRSCVDRATALHGCSPRLFRAFDSHGDLACTVKDRDVACDLPKNDDAWLRDTAVAVVDDKVVRPPEPERAGREVLLARRVRQGRWQIAGLLLTHVIVHLDRQREHLLQAPGRIVVGQCSGDGSPLGRD